MGFLSNLFGSGNSGKLKAALQDGAFLVDVREKMEFAEGSVKGAANIPLGTIAAELNKFKDKKHIVVFCRSGMRSGAAVSQLKQMGFTNVHNAGSWNKMQTLIQQK